jgi:hypothetical protein
LFIGAKGEWKWGSSKGTGMVTPFISNSVVLLSISYCANTHEINYVFLVDGIEIRQGGRVA